MSVISIFLLPQVTTNRSLGDSVFSSGYFHLFCSDRISAISGYVQNAITDLDWPTAQKVFCEGGRRRQWEEVNRWKKAANTMIQASLCAKLSWRWLMVITINESLSRRQQWNVKGAVTTVMHSGSVIVASSSHFPTLITIQVTFSIYLLKVVIAGQDGLTIQSPLNSCRRLRLMCVESKLSFCIFTNVGTLWKYGNASFSWTYTGYSPCLGDSYSKNWHNSCTPLVSFWTCCSWQFYLQKYTIFFFLAEMVRICLILCVVSRCSR